MPVSLRDEDEEGAGGEGEGRGNEGSEGEQLVETGGFTQHAAMRQLVHSASDDVS